MKRLYTILLLSIMFFVGIQAQVSYLNHITIKNMQTSKENNNLHLSLDVNADNLKLGSKQMILLTPVLESLDGITKLELRPIVIVGKNKNKILKRKTILGENTVNDRKPHTVVIRKNGTMQTIPYSANIPLEQWMKKARLTLKENVEGCADCGLGENNMLISERILDEPYIPTYKLAYIEPQVEPVKRRSASHAAHFNYKVARHELLPDFGNNAHELAEVDKVIREIQNDKDLTITDLTISGYASPEGSASSNLALSQRRANTFADYLVSKYGLSRNQFKVNWHGEDWKGLEEAVKSSSLSDKQAILNIINTVGNPDARDAQLKKLSKGQTYQMLLNTYYPPLRRNEYTVAYIARAFDVNEAKVIIKTKPQLLSLNEMYLVAQTYPADSKEFKEVFDIATRIYPNDPIAIINSAAADIEGGNNQAAIDRLRKIENDPRAWNNMAVAYARMGQTEKAKSYLERAIAKGDADAKINLEELAKALEN